MKQRQSSQETEETAPDHAVRDDNAENDGNIPGVTMRDYIETMRNQPGAFSVRGPQWRDSRGLSISSSENATMIDDVSISNVENHLPIADVVPTNQNEIVAYAMVPEDHIAVDNLTYRLAVEKNKFFNTMKLLIVISITILVTIIVLILLSLSSRMRNLPINPLQDFLNESIFLEALREIVLSANVSTKVDLYDPSTTQYKAMNWLGNVDSTEKIKTCKGFNESDDTETSYFHSCNNFESEMIQRYILGVIYFSTNGANWTENTPYLSNTHECDWQDKRGEILVPPSIVCDDELKVIGIHLYSLHLEGTIPNEIGYLSNLKTLYIGDNILTGTIPVTLSNLHQLERFHICCNSLTGTLPDVSNFKNVTFFSVWRNLLTGTISESIASMTSIDIIHFGTNKFTGTLPDVFDQLQTMTAFYAMDNFFIGTIPESITNLVNLDVLELGQNEFYGQIPKNFGEMKLLKSVSLSRNKLSGTIPDSFQDLKYLSRLDLSRNALTGSIPEFMVNLTSLVELDISINQITGNINFLCQPALPDSAHYHHADHSPKRIVVFKADCLNSVDCECCTHCF